MKAKFHIGDSVWFIGPHTHSGGDMDSRQYGWYVQMKMKITKIYAIRLKGKIITIYEGNEYYRIEEDRCFETYEDAEDECEKRNYMSKEEKTQLINFFNELIDEAQKAYRAGIMEVYTI